MALGVLLQNICGWTDRWIDCVRSGLGDYLLPESFALEKHCIKLLSITIKIDSTTDETNICTCIVLGQSRKMNTQIINVIH